MRNRGLLLTFFGPFLTPLDALTHSAVANHFRLTGGTKDDLRVTPVIRVKSNNPWVRLHLERQFINKYNLVEDGINVVL